MSVVIPVILCGGSGTRLWPLSRSDRPKQFISLSGDHTLLEGTLLRAGTIRGAGDPICVTAAAYGDEVRHSLDRLRMRGRLLLEPEARNTAPALCAAALVAMRTDSSAVIVALPADHVIEDVGAFATSIARAVVAAESGWLTILGVRPRHASSALGYIVPGAVIDDVPQVTRVNRFVEKPEPELAESLIVSGALWNVGIVVARADDVIETLRKHKPAVMNAVERSLGRGDSEADDIQLGAKDFAAAPRISFDKAVLERHEAVAVAALDAMWRDVGTWAEVAELYPADGDGNRNIGKFHLSSSRDTFVFSPNRLVVGIGLTGLVVVDTMDALLIAHRDDLEQIRGVVEDVAARYPDTIVTPEAVAAKIIVLGPGQSLHCEPDHRSIRHWIVKQGPVALITGKTSSIHTTNQSLFGTPGITHIFHNLGTSPVQLIEVVAAAGVHPAPMPT